MKNIVIFGPPGSGKGTQSRYIIDKFKVTHISTGEVLRKEISEKTPLGLEAQKYISQGALVPDDLIIDILSNKMECNKNEHGCIFDGFPRTTPQAAALKEMLQKRGQDIDIMLSLEVGEEELMARLLKRGEDSGRADDNLETIKKRIKVYNEQTAPVIDFYKKEKTYVAIEGAGSMDEIAAKIEEAITKA